MVLGKALGGHLVRERQPDADRHRGRPVVSALSALDDPWAVWAMDNSGVVRTAHADLLLLLQRPLAGRHPSCGPTGTTKPPAPASLAEGRQQPGLRLGLGDVSRRLRLPVRDAVRGPAIGLAGGGPALRVRDPHGARGGADPRPLRQCGRRGTVARGSHRTLHDRARRGGLREPTGPVRCCPRVLLGSGGAHRVRHRADLRAGPERCTRLLNRRAGTRAGAQPAFPADTSSSSMRSNAPRPMER